MHSAERELSAFIAAVRTVYGSEQAALSAEGWIEEPELMDSSPRSEVRNWHAVTIAASARLANRLIVAARRGQKPLGTSITGSKVSAIPSSNCSDYTDDQIVFEEVLETASAERRF
jgi:hypothetical protein